MLARNRARYLAPVALVVVITGTYIVVHAGLNDKPAKGHSHSARKPKPSQRRFASAKFYTVQGGDSLTSIASKTGIPISTLESLNPSADPNALQPGQRIRLRQ